jgi:hypothetical protein
LREGCVASCSEDAVRADARTHTRVGDVQIDFTIRENFEQWGTKTPGEAGTNPGKVHVSRPRSISRDAPRARFSAYRVIPHSVAHHPPVVSPASDGSASNSSAESCSALYSEPFEPQVYNNPAMLVIDKMLLFVHTSLRVYHPPTGSKAPRTHWNAATEPDLPSFRKNGHYLAVFRTRLHSGWSRLHEMLAIPTFSPAPSHNYTDAALPTHGHVRQVERLGLPSLLHGAKKAYDLDEIDDAIRPCAHGTMIAEGPSDARLFQFNGTLHMLFALWECYPDQNKRAGRGKLYASQYLTELHFDANPMQQTYPHQTLVRSIGKSVRHTLTTTTTRTGFRGSIATRYTSVYSSSPTSLRP